jgi:hypothetical protein
MIYNIFFSLHIIGFILFIGTTIVDFIFFRDFWKQYEQGVSGAKILFQFSSRNLVLNRVGALVVILAGIGMMTMVHGAYGAQLWMRIKIVLVVAAALNGIVIRRRQAIRLQEGLEKISGPMMQKIRSNLNLFHTIQLTLFFCIILLSVFRIDS